MEIFTQGLAMAKIIYNNVKTRLYIDLTAHTNNFTRAYKKPRLHRL